MDRQNFRTKKPFFHFTVWGYIKMPVLMYPRTVKSRFAQFTVWGINKLPILMIPQTVISIWHILVKNGSILVIERSKNPNFSLGIQIWDNICNFLHSLFTNKVFCRFWIPESTFFWVVTPLLAPVGCTWNSLDFLRATSTTRRCHWEVA